MGTPWIQSDDPDAVEWREFIAGWKRAVLSGLVGAAIILVFSRFAQSYPSVKDLPGRYGVWLLLLWLAWPALRRAVLAVRRGLHHASDARR